MMKKGTLYLIFIVLSHAMCFGQDENRFKYVPNASITNYKYVTRQVQRQAPADIGIKFAGSAVGVYDWTVSSDTGSVAAALQWGVGAFLYTYVPQINMGIQYELMYNRKGFEYTSKLPAGQKPQSAKYVLNYLDIPIMACFGGLGGFFAIGPQISFLMDVATVDATDKRTELPSTNMNSTIFGLVAGIESHGKNMYVSLRGSVDFTKSFAETNSFHQNTIIKNWYFQFAFGFMLGKTY